MPCPECGFEQPTMIQLNSDPVDTRSIHWHTVAMAYEAETRVVLPEVNTICLQCASCFDVPMRQVKPRFWLPADEWLMEQLL